MDCQQRAVLEPRVIERTKVVKCDISKKITKDEYLTATFGALLMFIGAYFLVILVSCIICVRYGRSLLN